MNGPSPYAPQVAVIVSGLTRNERNVVIESVLSSDVPDQWSVPSVTVTRDARALIGGARFLVESNQLPIDVLRDALGALREHMLTVENGGAA